MIELVDLAKIRVGSDDADELRSLLKQLVNQPFVAFRVSYGDELQIHLGETRVSKYPKGRGMTLGTYIVTTRASAWSLLSGTRSVLLTNATEAEAASESGGPNPNQQNIHVIESNSHIAPGSTIQSATPFVTKHGFGLSLKFTDSSEFFLTPSAPEPEDDEFPIADWEVFTPREHLLKVGPGPTWSYMLDSSSPEDGA